MTTRPMAMMAKMIMGSPTPVPAVLGHCTVDIGS